MTSKTMNDFVSNEDEDSLGSIESMGILIENEDSDYYDFIEYEDKIKYVIEKKMPGRSASIIKSNMYQRLLNETIISKNITNKLYLFPDYSVPCFSGRQKTFPKNRTNTRFVVVTGLDNRNMRTGKRLYDLIEYITKLVEEGKHVRLISIFNDVRDIGMCDQVLSNSGHSRNPPTIDDNIYYDSQGILYYHDSKIEEYVSNHPDRSNIIHIDKSYL